MKLNSRAQVFESKLCFPVLLTISGESGLSKMIRGAKILSIQKKIRVRREDSVFVYWVLESHEGIAAYSTLGFKPGDPHRDLMIFIPPDFHEEAERVLTSLGDIIYELKDD